MLIALPKVALSSSFLCSYVTSDCSLKHAAVSKNTVYEHAEFSIRNNHDLEYKTSKYEVRKCSQIETKELGRQNREKGSTCCLTALTRPPQW